MRAARAIVGYIPRPQHASHGLSRPHLHLHLRPSPPNHFPLAPTAHHIPASSSVYSPCTLPFVPLPSLLQAQSSSALCPFRRKGSQAQASRYSRPRFASAFGRRPQTLGEDQRQVYVVFSSQFSSSLQTFRPSKVTLVT